jgi:hypothetical protein
MTDLQQGVFDAIARSEAELGQIIEPNLKKIIMGQIETWTDNECTKYLNELMVNNAKRKNLKRWCEQNQNTENDSVEIKITLKEFLGL